MMQLPGVSDATLDGSEVFAASPTASDGTTGLQIVINDGLGGFEDVFDSTADELVSA